MPASRAGADGATLRPVLVRQVVPIAALALLAPAAVANAHPGPWYWSKPTLVQNLSGRHFFIGAKKVVIRTDTLTCDGEGRGVVRRRVRMWKHFDCTQPTFPSGALVGPDAIFRVHVVGRRKFLITGAHFAHY
jgi:hypothetical protein